MNGVADASIEVNVSHDTEIFLKSQLQWANPDYAKKVAMGKSTWGTPKDIVLWQKKGNSLIVPFGMLQSLREMGVSIAPSRHLMGQIRQFDGKIDNLYDYQEEALKSALKARNGVLVAPCGSGKTQIGLAICAELGYNTLWLTHTHELLKQSMDRAKQYLNVPMGTITGGKINAVNGITFATVQTMAKIDLSYYKDFWDVIIVDECFPANTKILTPTGQKELSSLRIGDIIVSYNVNTGEFENKPVIDTFKLYPHDIVKVRLSNGKEIACTANHPFYTLNGEWKKARELNESDYVMQVLWKRDSSLRNFKNKLVQKSKKRMGLLFKRMFIKRWKVKGGLDRGAESKGKCKYDTYELGTKQADFGKNEKEQSYGSAGCERSCIKTIERDCPLSKDQMRKWDGSNCSSAEIDDSIVGTCVCLRRVSNSNKGKKRLRVSNLLQSGHCDSRKHDSCGSRWEQPLCYRTEKSRCKERCVSEWIRVESVEVQEQTSDGTFGGLCEDGFVYNIEVAGNNNYIADGVLVHNCHRCVGTPTQITMFWKVVSSLSARYKFGLTATPKRADGMEKAMFALLGPKFYEISRDDVKGATVPLNVVEPIATGWEPDFEKVLNPDGTLNYTSLITDCVESEERNAIVADVINTAAKDGTTLVLSERVAHLEKLAQMCNYSNGNLSSSKKSERKNLLKSVSDGEIRVLFATYAIAKEGLDIPCLQHLVMASPIKDQIAVTQSAGRVMRAYPDKEFGTLWDFEDNMTMLQKWLKKRLSIYGRLEQ